ncbi:MAG: YggS family pyridoxal phosphate-dependent enzyme [Candidatus Zixiibacteriota bacterium]|nr:MAG: YggS family pyridoxal phosphate-dependent enzyme [candidate division Zixibacteria bacterium]
MFDFIEENIKIIMDQIEVAAGRSGRSAGEITLVAISKTHLAAAIEAAISYGITDIGESRIQEAEPKITSLGNIARWHMVGHLQTNKAKKAVRLFDMVQSVDSLKLARELDKAAAAQGKILECLLEVNSSKESAKFGVVPGQALEAVEKMRALTHLRLCGVMTIGPFTDNKEKIRSSFRSTRRIFDRAREIAGNRFAVLSMGMSDDFELAIEEGSTMIRIGTAIFGPRGV